MKKFKFSLKSIDDNGHVSVERYLGLSLVIGLLLLLMFLVTNLEYYMREKTDIIDNKKYMSLIGREQETAPDTREETFVLASKNKKVERALDFLAIPYSKVEIKDLINRQENLVLDGTNIKTKDDVESLKKFAKNNKKIIFLNMPSEQLIKETELKDILGIAKIMGEKERTEINLVKEFFIGGVHEIEDMKFKNLDVKLMYSTKVYSYAEEESPVVWRNIYDKSEVYVVNGPFMESSTATGFLSAIMSKSYKDFLYPIINTRFTSYEGFPYISYTNTEKLEELYNRNAMKFQHDILLKDILNISTRRNFIPNGYLRVGFEEEVDISKYDVKEIKNIKEYIYTSRGDIGIRFSGDAKKDREIYKDIFGVLPKSILIDKSHNLKDVVTISDSITSVIGPWKEESNFKYLNKDMVYIPFTVDGIEYKGAETLKFLSAVSGLGVIVENLNIEDVIVSQENTETWTSFSKKYIKFMDQYREQFKFLESRNAQSTSDAVKVFTKNSTHIFKDRNTIKLEFKVWNGESHFLLRTDKLIKDIKGGEALLIEEGTFLITAKNQEVLIKLKPKANLKVSR